MAWRNPHYDPHKPHHTPQGFRNPDPDTRGSGDLRRWRRERREQGLPKPPAGGYDAFRSAWCGQADFGGGEDAAWWLGHASVLLRVGERTVLTDPILSGRASPLRFAGPQRRTPPAATVATLPPIDAVLLSHNHYDHLDYDSIRRLVRRFPDAAFLVPLGLGDWLRRRGARSVHELDWWDATEVHGLRFDCAPARHWSARTPWDTNRSLWCGWTVRRAAFAFYFAGDTGWSERLGEIARLGPFDLAAIPIGAYSPRWFMRGQHIDPAEAVRLHRAVGARRSIGIHWGTFELADDALDEPPRLLADARRAASLADEAFRTVRIGERIVWANASSV
ncbi:MBL fold metallo-hydrolase [Coralloluteibacterium stylophorae]|uniref:MBL fold metallo-hydrolase n=1 Tax=Coralloluteibacterium stylophorae TaxID=1776034 RepID=A0AAP2FVW8_9GAMM|nr:MBL fold metallo-hydrolase [Coralloluteibacterium stylophorae]MBS7455609.1 MBL fold metallo-hydrolase [Coralloluteibacterium stylophorae]